MTEPTNAEGLDVVVISKEEKFWKELKEKEEQNIITEERNIKIHQKLIELCNENIKKEQDKK